MNPLDRIQAAMGWQPLSQRHACLRCTHAKVVGVWEEELHCMKGHFKTMYLALCDEFQPESEGVE